MNKLRLHHKGLYHGICLTVSAATAVIAWSIVSSMPDIGSVIVGFLLGFFLSIPVAFLLGWYEGFRVIVEPWIQFLRTIPPIALIPIVIATFGIGTSAKIAIIFFAVFLTMVITIYQGVKNVDATLIKAAMTGRYFFTWWFRQPFPLFSPVCGWGWHRLSPHWWPRS